MQNGYNRFIENVTLNQVLGIIIIMLGIFLLAVGLSSFLELKELQNNPLIDGTFPAATYRQLYTYMGLGGLLIGIGLFIILKRYDKNKLGALDDDEFEQEESVD